MDAAKHSATIPTSRTALAILCAPLIAVLLSCSPDTPTDPGQTQGQIEVEVSTTGTGQPASFTVRLDGGSPRSVTPNGSVTYSALATGNYQVQLVVPSNCTVNGSSTQTVGVQEAATATASFSVICSAVPTGAIGVTTSTTGSPADPDGYTVSVDGGAGQTIGVNGTRLIADLAVGEHDVELTGVADNCLVQGANPRSVDVSEGQTTQTEFEVVCSATTGRIDVSVSTTGLDADQDGYTVSLDGGASSQPIQVDGSITFQGVEEGTHTLELEEVAANCTVTSTNPVSADVVAGETTDVAFTVDCAATTGGLTVTATTTGDEIDANGYTVSVDGGTEQALAVNGSTSFPALLPGEHDVLLGGVAANCSVAGGASRTVTVTAGSTTQTDFDVTCSSTVGGIEVTVTTTGEAIDADGYTVSLDGGVGQPIASNPPGNVITFTGLDPDEYTLQLQNVADNCEVTSANPTTADVVAGEFADVAFTVDCEELTGTVQVDISTTGSQLDPNGYTLQLDGGSNRSVNVNDSETYTNVVIGPHQVRLTGVASNCAVQGSNPRNITVNEGATTQVDFDVVCSATTGQIQVTVTESGDDIDPDGYTVDLDGVSSQPVDQGAPALFTGVTPGSHDLRLANVAGNCTVDDSEKSTTVTAGSTAMVSFAVTCTRTTGEIRVTTNTSGSPVDPNGYTVTVQGEGSEAVGVDDEVLFDELQPDDYTVTISDVAVNCTVSGGTTRNVTVNAAQETDVVFDISCVPLVGSIRVNVTTNGPDPDPDGYDARLDGNPASDLAVATDGSVIFGAVSVGLHSVTLVDVASNCEIAGSDSKPATVVFNTTVDVDFTVDCTQLTGSVQVSVTTSGDDIDGSYTATLSGGQGSMAVSDGSPATFSDVPVGSYTVTLSGIETNCEDDGGDEQEPAEVTADATENVAFSITCSATTGSITVTTNTTGAAPDPDGYSVTLDGGSAMFVDDGSPATYADLAPNTYSVALGGLDGSCAVTNGNPQTPTVSAGAAAPVAFDVDCP